MKWDKVREVYPNKWVVLEAVEAHSVDGYRILDNVEVQDVCTDAMEAFCKHAALQKQWPRREFYFFHTLREALDIHEKKQLRWQRA